jgi:Zn-dependent peptidase ImmA (M78 family)
MVLMVRADDAAQRLLRQFGVAEAPVRLDPITEGLDAIVVTQELEPDVSGMLVREDDGLIIGVNKHHSLVRRRFTVAHELGHLQLHPGRALILDTSVRINFRDRLSSLATDREEIEANRFAAALLMPQELVVQATTGAPRDPDELVRLLARRFKVSEPAMGYRLINLGLLS